MNLSRIGVHLWKQAVEKAGSFDVDKVREALIGQTFKGPAGEVTIQENHHLINNVYIGETLATYNDLDDFDGSTFSPPIDARRQALANYTGWSQSISVQKVDVNRVATVVPSATVSPTLRFTVTVQRYGNTIYTESWMISQGQ